MAPASPRHGAIQAEVTRLIGNHLADLRPACRIAVEAGIQPRVRADHNIRVPDVTVTCTAAWEADDSVLHEPLLLIEILSPSNTAATWANVWSYTTIPTVAEILVLHTEVVRADLLRRDDSGEWPDNPIKVLANEAVELMSIGFSVPLSAFYRTAG